MFSFLFVVISIFSHVASDFSMIEVYGKPVTFKAAKTNASLTWRNCMTLCLKTPMCAVAYNKSGCQWFSYMNITTVNQTTAKDGQVVAFKIQNTASTCPTGTNPPTFNNKAATTNQILYNGISTNPVNVTTTIKYSKAVWTISYTSKGACSSDNLVYFSRPKMGWCIMLMLNQQSATYAASVSTCKDFGLVMTGAINAVEAKWFLTSAEWFRQYTPGKDYVVRLDGVRSTACRSTPTTATCKNVTGFVFSDSNVNTIDYYSWATNPGAMAKSDSNCLVMVVQGTKAIKTDVQSCSAATNLPAYGIMCGREAWNW